MVAAAIGGCGRFDLHRCRGVEHEVHDIPAYSFQKHGRSLAHEFNDSFLAVGLKPETIRDPYRSVGNGRYQDGQRRSSQDFAPVRSWRSTSSTASMTAWGLSNSIW